MRAVAALVAAVAACLTVVVTGSTAAGKRVAGTYIGNTPQADAPGAFVSIRIDSARRLASVRVSEFAETCSDGTTNHPASRYEGRAQGLSATVAADGRFKATVDREAPPVAPGRYQLELTGKVANLVLTGTLKLTRIYETDAGSKTCTTGSLPVRAPIEIARKGNTTTINDLNEDELDDCRDVKSVVATATEDLTTIKVTTYGQIGAAPCAAGEAPGADLYTKRTGEPSCTVGGAPGKARLYCGAPKPVQATLKGSVWTVRFKTSLMRKGLREFGIRVLGPIPSSGAWDHAPAFRPATVVVG